MEKFRKADGKMKAGKMVDKDKDSLQNENSLTVEGIKLKDYQ